MGVFDIALDLQRELQQSPRLRSLDRLELVLAHMIGRGVPVSEAMEAVGSSVAGENIEPKARPRSSGHTSQISRAEESPGEARASAFVDDVPTPHPPAYEDRRGTELDVEFVT